MRIQKYEQAKIRILIKSSLSNWMQLKIVELNRPNYKLLTMHGTLHPKFNISKFARRDLMECEDLLNCLTVSKVNMLLGEQWRKTAAIFRIVNGHWWRWVNWIENNNSNLERCGRNLTNDWTCSCMEILKEQRNYWRSSVNTPRNGWITVSGKEGVKE